MESYQAPELNANSTGDELFAEHHNVGINFSKYSDIPVTLSGENAPAPIATFTSIKLNPAIMDNIARAKYETPTPVQKYAIPTVLAGRDLMVCLLDSVFLVSFFSSSFFYSCFFS
jgi:ATP-dependent RNA helicase DDX3X